MAQATTATRRTTITLPKTRSNTKAALKQGSAPQAEKPVDKAGETPVPKVNESIWVSALNGAAGFHRNALQVELAVGLSVFAVKADAAKATLPAKKALRAIYAEADYACGTPQGADYKTVQRRINVTADLYQWLGGRETIVDWTAEAAPSKQIQAIMDHLKNYKFGSINDVLAQVGKPVAVKRPRNEGTQAGAGEGGQEGSQTPQGGSPAPTGGGGVEIASLVEKALEERRAQGLKTREEDKLPPGRIFQHGPMRVAVPMSATYEDVMALVADLTVFAANQLRVASAATSALAANAVMKAPVQELAAA